MSFKANTSLNSLEVVHKGLLIGQVIFALVASFLLFDNRLIPPFKEYDRILQLHILSLSFGGFYIGTFYILKRQVEQIKKRNLTAGEKFSSYRKACMMQWALIEGPCLISIMCFLLVGNISFLALAGTLMVLFALLAPTSLKIQLLLKLREEDLANL